jgi:hypothetical protein
MRKMKTRELPKPKSKSNCRAVEDDEERREGVGLVSCNWLKIEERRGESSLRKGRRKIG